MTSANGGAKPWGWSDLSWPWLVLLLMVVPAVWHAVDFPGDVDPEYPRVERPTFSRRPPPAYRLAEPGDTIDRVGLYLAAGGVMLAVAGVLLDRSRPWNWALALGLVAVWYAATPGPTFDGWHGLGWRLIGDSEGPIVPRLLLAGAGGLLVGFVLIGLWSDRASLGQRWRAAHALGIRSLLLLAALLVILRQFEIPDVEPVGYWPRWAFVWGMGAFDLALVRGLLARVDLPTRRLWVVRLGGFAGWAALVVAGIWLTWYHRPLARMRAVVPGKIYISAMPTYQGLTIAHGRHQFKTIINVFAEDTPLRSPILPDELRFVSENGIRYLNAPPEQSKADAFLDETLRLAQDPDAWPILVHCHGCMDRSPAWMGIYRFLVQNRPLDEIFREIEGHRGYRPKSSVILLYNRVLKARAPERYLGDPTGRRLWEGAKGTVDPYYELVRRELERKVRR